MVTEFDFAVVFWIDKAAATARLASGFRTHKECQIAINNGIVTIQTSSKKNLYTTCIDCKVQLISCWEYSLCFTSIGARLSPTSSSIWQPTDDKSLRDTLESRSNFMMFFWNFARLKNWWPIMEKGGGPGGSGKAMSVRLLQGMLGASLVMNAFLLLALTHSSSHEAAQTRNR